MVRFGTASGSSAFRFNSALKHPLAWRSQPRRRARIPPGSRHELPLFKPIQKLLCPRRGFFAGAAEAEPVRAFFIDVQRERYAGAAECAREEERVFNRDGFVLDRVP